MPPLALRSSLTVKALLATSYLVAGCGGATTPRLSTATVDRLVGEVTIHEFPDWTHAWAVFLTDGVPFAQVRYDSILHPPPHASMQLGACEVIRGPVCHVPCGSRAYCQADDHCMPYPERTGIDAGTLSVVGGRGSLEPMTMRFDAASALYDSTPPPGPGLVFAGGEPLTIALEGGSGVPASRTTLTTPPPLALIAPSLDPFLLPPAGPLHFSWTPGNAEFLEILLVASSNADASRWTSIRCLTDDGGDYDMPVDVLATLPAPPRSLHLEVTRNAEQVVPTDARNGILIHAGYTVATNTVDD
jgi:hypothetical protein